MVEDSSVPVRLPELKGGKVGLGLAVVLEEVTGLAVVRVDGGGEVPVLMDGRGPYGKVG